MSVVGDDFTLIDIEGAQLAPPRADPLPIPPATHDGATDAQPDAVGRPPRSQLNGWSFAGQKRNMWQNPAKCGSNQRVLSLVLAYGIHTTHYRQHGYQASAITLVRRASEVPSEELQFALLHMTEDSQQIPTDELIAGVARLFGWKRLGANIRLRLEGQLDLLLRQDVLVSQGCLVRTRTQNRHA